MPGGCRAAGFAVKRLRGQLKQYFSSYERETLKTRLRQLKDTEADPVVKQMVDHVNGLMVLVISLSIH